ncbi:MAG: prolipoprotein diacylglyceryl transferase [Cyanobacteria bacterium SIG30]|nr:prolipoprotein diacylglyceryl transferase [Cyanobacteria bacterium SIG30]
MISAPESSYIFFGIKYYSVFMMFAILSGSYVSYYFAKKYFKNNTDTNILLDILPITILSGILGARIYYVIANFSYFSQNLNEIIKIQNGGISIHGAILGGFLGAFLFCKIKKIKILPYADTISFGLILAQAIGRFGNYFNQEAFGKPYNGFLKMYINKEHRPLDFIEFEYFHPTFLYEIILNLIIFLILYIFLRNRKKEKNGSIFFLYLILYSIARFIIESVRIDSVLYISNMPIAQIASIVLLLIGIIGLSIIYKDDAF